MPIFEYRVSDATGKILTGSLTSASRDEAIGELDARGYTLVSLVEKEAAKASASSLSRMFNKLSVKELAIFTRQLATLIRAGVPMMSTLTALSHQAENEFLRETISEIQDDVEQGASLSIAMGKHPDFFNELYVNTVMAGETGGALDEVLDRLALLLEGDAETQANIKAAARYPIMVVLALAIAFFVLVIWVVPKFSSLFASRGVTLPLPTRVLLGINYGIQNYWFFIIPAIVAIVAGIRLFIRTESGRFLFDGLKLRVPIFGPILTKAVMCRFSQMFATLSRSGLPALRIMDVLSRSIGNKVVGREVEALAESIREGGNMSEFLNESPLFPPMVSHMVAVGEQSGALDEMLDNVYRHYDAEVKTAIKNLTSMIEPILIVGLGIIVLIFALAIYMPMWDLITVYTSKVR